MYTSICFQVDTCSGTRPCHQIHTQLPGLLFYCAHSRFHRHILSAVFPGCLQLPGATCNTQNNILRILAAELCEEVSIWKSGTAPAWSSSLRVVSSWSLSAQQPKWGLFLTCAFLTAVSFCASSIANCLLVIVATFKDWCPVLAAFPVSSRSCIVEYLKCYKIYSFIGLFIFGMHLWIGILILFIISYMCVSMSVYPIFFQRAHRTWEFEHISNSVFPMACFISSSISLLEIWFSLHHIQKRLVILHCVFSAVIARGSSHILHLHD